MNARLFSKIGPFAGKSFVIGEEATIGRNPDNAVVLADAAVSGRHGRIFWDAEEECYRIEDLGSRNGTFVAGLRVHQPERLEHLEVIGIAEVGELIFLEGKGDRLSETHLDVGFLMSPPELVEAAAQDVERTALDLEAFAPPPNLGLAPAAEKAPVEGFFLEVESEARGRLRFPLAPGEHLIGRGQEADVVIDNPALSRAHARLIVDADGVRLVDLGSSNGTRVAGAKSAPNIPVALAPGTEIELGSVLARLVRGPIDS